MGIDQIKSEIAGLSEEQQNHLAAFLVSLRHQRDDSVVRKITERLDDRDPAHWATLDQLREKWRD